MIEKKYNSANRLGKKRAPYKKRGDSNLINELEKDILKKRSVEAVKELAHDNFKDSIVASIEENIEEIKKYNPEIIKEEIKPPVIEQETEGQKELRLAREKNAQLAGENVYEDWMKDYRDTSNDKKDPENEVEEKEEPKDPKEKRKYQKRQKELVDAERELKDANAQFANGAMLITFCDLIFPGIILFFFQKIKKDPRAKKVKHVDLCLSDDQVQAIEGVSDYAARIIFEYVNPMVLFLLQLGTMYYMNYKNALEIKGEK